MIKTEDYPLSRVPQDKKVSFFSVAIVYMGALTSLDQFMLGAVLGHSMTLTDAFTALFVASLIFCVVTYGLGIAGMREGVSGTLVWLWTLGSRASRDSRRSQFARLVWYTECYFR